MDKSQALEIAREISQFIHERTNNLQIKYEKRTSYALAVFQHALDIADGIVVLIEKNLPGVAWSLVRSMHESYVRAVWLLGHANPDQLDNFEKGICPKLATLVKCIGDEPESGGVWIKGITDLNISAFHDLAHGGMEHVSRRVTANSVEPNYPEEEIINLLTLRNQYYYNIGVFLLAIFQEESGLNDLNNKARDWEGAL